jgi:S-DNA-T family DNA segregation ATPase FtsK/SpoIIIE
LVQNRENGTSPAVLKDRRLEILGILTIAISLLVLISLIGYSPNEDPGISPNVHVENPLGIIGVYLSYFFIKFLFGYPTFLIPILGLIWGWLCFSQKELTSFNRIAGYVFGACVLLSVTIGLIEIGMHDRSGLDFTTSGLVGGNLANFLYSFLGIIGTGILLIALWLVLVRGYFEFSLYEPLEKLGITFKKKRDEQKLKKEIETTEEAKRLHTQDLLNKIDAQREGEDALVEADAATEEKVVEQEDEAPPAVPESISQTHVPIEEKEEQTVGEIKDESTEELIETEQSEDDFQTEIPDKQTGEVQPPVDENIEVGEMVEEDEVNLDEVSERQLPKREYQLPLSDLLATPVNISDSMSRDELVDRANFLTQSLLTFGVEGKVVNVSPGPVITLFEVEPAEGVRVNKFVALSDDLARVMEASRVRVIAPIPGKSSVGIEIPNRNPATVYFKSVINSEKFASSDSKLILAIGKNTSGEIATLDLANMPHLLIAGTTGSGKSVCLNSIICSLLYSSTPDELKFVIVDPKKVEMSLYRALADYHLLSMEDIDEPIITNVENAAYALRSVEREMGRRYDVLADAVVRNIDEYNKKMQDSGEPIMPFIVVVVDELADLMMLNAREVEAPIARLAQLARAVGIHLVIATQRPSVDVITGLIKANFPSRIAFQVASKIDSRTIIDMPGAEKLIGRGDMLYLGSGSSDPVRLHNAFLSLEEIESLMTHIQEQPKAAELILPSIREGQLVDGIAVDGAEDGDQDELLHEAIRLVVTHQQGSISLIQRRLKVGYSRAARLIDQMEQIAVVGPFTGSKAREVLVDETYLLHLED